MAGCLYFCQRSWCGKSKSPKEPSKKILTLLRKYTLFIVLVFIISNHLHPKHRCPYYSLDGSVHLGTSYQVCNLERWTRANIFIQITLQQNNFVVNVQKMVDQKWLLWLQGNHRHHMHSLRYHLNYHRLRSWILNQHHKLQWFSKLIELNFIKLLKNHLPQVGGSLERSKLAWLESLQKQSLLAWQWSLNMQSKQQSPPS